MLCFRVREKGVCLGINGVGQKDFVLSLLYLCFLLHVQLAKCKVQSVSDGNLNFSSSKSGGTGLRTGLNPQQKSSKLVDTDPLDIGQGLVDDYTNWASIVSMILLEEEKTEYHANKALVYLMKLTHKRIIRMLEGDFTPPNLSIQDNVFNSLSGKANGLPGTTFTGLSTSKVFFDYQPCIFSSNVQGIGVETTLLDISPSLFYLQAAIQEVTVTGLNLQPSVIYISPNGGYWNPSAVQATPALASIYPEGLSIQPIGVQVAPSLLSIQNIGVNINPVGLSSNQIIFNAQEVYSGDGASTGNASGGNSTGGGNG
eukprot:jgi/Botrbrau1/8611/Bobra.0196s0011.1